MLPPGSGMVRQREIMHRNIGKSGIYFDLRSTKCRYHVRYPEFPVPGGTPGFPQLVAVACCACRFRPAADVARHRQVAELRGALGDVPRSVGCREPGVARAGRFGEVVCAAGCVAGLLYRLALIPMVFTMCVAFFAVHGGDSFAARELALVYLVVFVLMYAAGPGRYAADTLIAQRIRAPKR